MIEQPAPENAAQQDDRLVFLGPDENGAMLEVMAVDIETGLLVVHAMPIRRKYLDYIQGDSDDQP